MKSFTKEDLKDLYIAPSESNGEDNGQITIIGGSDLFHGAPLFALKTASRIVDMVFFSSSYEQLKDTVNYMQSELSSFIWVPFEEIDKYVEKSDACLIGPGFKRYGPESSPHKHDTSFCDDECQNTRKVTYELLSKHKNKKWVIDAGSLQTMEAEWIPASSVLTPNKKEFEMLFEMEPTQENAEAMAKKYNCVIVLKGPISIVSGSEYSISVEGGNAGLTKGGTGDVLAGLITALLSKNDPILSASAASFIQKKAAEEMAIDVGTYFNSDDLADQIPYTFKRLT